MELRITAPTEDGFLKEVTFNYEELEKELTDKLDKFKGLVVTEDKLKENAATRAQLNAFKKALSDKRIEIKNKILVPYEAFKLKMDKLESMVQAPIDAIDKQIKSFEEKTKADKKKKIEEIYLEKIGKFKELLPFDNIFDSKWLNSGTTIKKIEEALDVMVDTTKKDLVVIDSLQVDESILISVKDTYFKTRNLSIALMEKQRLQDQKVKMAQAGQAPKEQPKPAPLVEAPIEKESEAIAEINFKVFVTVKQLKALKEYFVLNQIKVERIENGSK